MSNHIVICNKLLSQANNHLTNGNPAQALISYQKSLKYTYLNPLKQNLKCTISILHSILNQHQKSIEICQEILSQLHQNKYQNLILVMRVLVNIFLVELVQQRHQKALDYFEKLAQILQGIEESRKRNQLVDYVMYLIFRVRDSVCQNLDDDDNVFIKEKYTNMSVQEAYANSVMCYIGELFDLQSQQKIQRICYQTFVRLNRHDLAIFSLRSLLKFTKNPQNQEQYEKQLAKLVMMGFISTEIDLYNMQSVDIMKAVLEALKGLKIAVTNNGVLQEKNKIVKSCRDSDERLMKKWKFITRHLIKNIQKNTEIDKENRNALLQHLSKAFNEKNIMVIKQMSEKNLFQKHQKQIKQKLFKIYNISRKRINSVRKQPFDLIFNSLRLEKSEKSEFTKESNKNKENHHQGISIISSHSSKKLKQSSLSTNKKHTVSINPNYLQMESKKLSKMVRMCQHGGFLNKRNFNSEGGEMRFVKITNSFIKWGKDPQKIQNNCSIYPLKDIKSIVYGRISPNLNESSNKILQYSNCFSLLLQKRTLDFYCRNYEEAEAWVCGITQILKKQGNKIVGYTPGKLRWKKMFAILNENFIEPLKFTDKNKYYYQDAYATVLFSKNGCKLPSKK